MDEHAEYSGLTAGDREQRCTVRYVFKARSKVPCSHVRMCWNKEEREITRVIACNEQLFVSLILFTGEHFSFV